MDADEFDGNERDSAEGAEGGPGLHQPHDKLFAATFGEPENTAALLRAELPAELAAAIDWDTLKHEPGSFVDPGFRRAHSDLLFSLELRFGSVPTGLAEAVRLVSEETALRNLLRAAIQSVSLEEFSKAL